MTPGAAESGPRALRTLAPWLAPVLAAAAVLAIYLAPFVRDPGRLPPGQDTPGYVWRARAVYELGFDALPSFRDRPGHPVLVSVLRDVTGATPLDLARAWPAVIGAAIGLAALALAAVGSRERPWVGVALAIGVAASSFVAATAVGYAANLLVDLFVVAAIALALHVLGGGGGVPAIGVLVVAAAVTHWLFALLLVGLLALVGVAALVWPWGADDEPSGRAGRLLVPLAVAAALGAAAMLLAPELPSEIVHQTFEGDVDRRIERRLPALALPLTLPAAGVGAIVIASVGGRLRRRRTLPTMIAWAAIAPAGLVAWYGLHLRFPPYRTAAVALGVPALIVLGAAAPSAGLFERGRRAAAIAAAALLLAATAWLTAMGAATWWGAEPAVGRSDLAQAATLDAYLGTLPPGTTAVVPIPPGATRPPRILRLGLDARHAGAVVLVPADLSRGLDAFVEDVLGRSPAGTVIVFLDAYRRPPQAGVALGPGVTLVHGPRPAETVAPSSNRTNAFELLRASAVVLALLLVSGFGWALALTGLRPLDALGLAPAVGAAALLIVGLVAGRLGVSYAGGAAAVAAATTATGWIAWLARRRLVDGSTPPARA